MPHEPRDAAYLWDMYSNAKAVMKFTKGIDLNEYLSDEDNQLVIERRIEIIGEAARRVSESLKSAHPEIPWRLIIAQRNVLIHDYDEIDHVRIWKLVLEQIPKLIVQLEPLLPPVPPTIKE